MPTGQSTKESTLLDRSAARFAADAMLFEEDHHVDPLRAAQLNRCGEQPPADPPKVQVSLCASTIATYLQQSESTLAANGVSGFAGLYG
jgi:hypothetical protein